ncbi:MAG: biopolymer transporter ExbD [Burkholderiales bacterium]|mgnify:CR=1 FL=1|nr:biopolymer transporter ExbD [Burkholderiales bacterium]MBK8665083.1 biopolymer transporter ExbD [Burkholderiales bacterium]
MKFGRQRPEEPEINLIPFIDVLLVILIFLMLTTTYSRFTELQLSLPVADAEALRERPQEIVVAIAADGRYAINRTPLTARGVEAVAQALRPLAVEGSVLVVSADAAAPVQAVISVLDAARREGLTRITFAAQTSSALGAP